MNDQTPTPTQPRADSPDVPEGIRWAVRAAGHISDARAHLMSSTQRDHDLSIKYATLAAAEAQLAQAENARELLIKLEELTREVRWARQESPVR